jgi:hypothetical protein
MEKLEEKYEHVKGGGDEEEDGEENREYKRETESKFNIYVILTNLKSYS